MALLNYSSKYANIKSALNESALLPNGNPNPEFHKLYFTGDGHIVTHGFDYTRLFSASLDGLVPKSTGKKTDLLRADGTWAKITTADLPISGDIVGTGSTTTILNSKLVVDYIKNWVATSDAMRFKGSIGIKAEGGKNVYYHTGPTGSEVTGFPSTCERGDTYRIASASDAHGGLLYGGHRCSVGDMLICIKDGSTSSGNTINSKEYWTAIEGNINGIITHTINGAPLRVYSDATDTYQFYAPTTAGDSKGLVLISSGSAETAPTWISSETLVAKDITEAAKKKLFTSLTAVGGKISATIGGTSLTATASGTWGIHITGQAGYVKESLSAGTGLLMKAAYNGSAAQTINLAIASTTLLGGVMADNTALQEHKCIGPTVTIDAGGKLHLTKQNILNALGFIPGNSVDNTSYTLDSSSAAESNPVVKLMETSGSLGTSTTGQFLLLGNTSLGISRTGTVISFVLKKASADVLGGIKTGFTTNTAKKQYAVKMSGDNAYVEVPWIDTTYKVVAKTTNGLAPSWDTKQTAVVTQQHYVLVNNGTTVEWRPLHANAFTNTWREIQVNGAPIGNKKLNIKPSEDICFIVDNPDTSDVYELSLGLSWYNIDTKSFETA